MAINRRDFLKLVLSASVVGSAGVAAKPVATKLLSCRSNLDGQHFASLLDPTKGVIEWDVELPSRGHGVTVSPDNIQAVVFARRPGDYFWVLDIAKREVSHKIVATQDRHYFGHGCFSHDGKRLYVTENDFESSQGRIGVYDAANGFVKISEFPSYGIGPHELRLLNHKNVLVIANGGIKTHPDMPRAKLNLNNMRPNLAYVDANDGSLVSLHEPPEKWHQLSIRHIDVSATDQVAIAMQYEGDKRHLPPLIAMHNGVGDLTMLEAPADVQRRLKHYCGSVVYSEDGAVFAVSSPRGGLITYWDSDGKYLAKHHQAEVCGLAKAHGLFWASDGRGGLQAHRAKPARAFFAETFWDNHMLEII